MSNALPNTPTNPLLQRRGFTLIEILIVLGIVGILATTGSVALLNASKRGQERDIAIDITTALLRARTEAQRFNTNATFSLGTLVAGKATSYSTTQVQNGQTVTRTVNLPTGITIEPATSGGATQVVYTAPFGEVNATGAIFRLALTQGANTTTVGTVGVVGLAGKAVVLNN